VAVDPAVTARAKMDRARAVPASFEVGDDMLGTIEPQQRPDIEQG